MCRLKLSTRPSLTSEIHYTYNIAELWLQSYTQFPLNSVDFPKKVEIKEIQTPSHLTSNLATYYSYYSNAASL